MKNTLAPSTAIPPRPALRARLSFSSVKLGTRRSEAPVASDDLGAEPQELEAHGHEEAEPAAREADVAEELARVDLRSFADLAEGNDPARDRRERQEEPEEAAARREGQDARDE